jgi:opacity protein-like surface antigen
MKISVIAVAVLISLAGASICAADPLRTGGYMSGFIGTSVIRDVNVTNEVFSSGDLFNDRIELDPGINIGITGGHNFGFFRLEGELSYKGGEINDITDQDHHLRYRNVDGEISMLAVMMNGFFDLRNPSPVTPYFGGGVGFATVSLSDTEATVIDSNGSASRKTLYFDDFDSTFACQVGGGLEIELNRALSLDLGYRYFVTSNVKLNSDWDSRTEFKLKSHNASVGFRLKF